MTKESNIEVVNIQIYCDSLQDAAAIEKATEQGLLPGELAGYDSHDGQSLQLTVSCNSLRDAAEVDHALLHGLPGKIIAVDIGVVDDPLSGTPDKSGP